MLSQIEFEYLKCFDCQNRSFHIYRDTNSINIRTNGPYNPYGIRINSCNNLKKVYNTKNERDLSVCLCSKIHNITFKHLKSYLHLEIYQCNRLCKIPKCYVENSVFIANNKMLLQCPKIITNFVYISGNTLLYVPYYMLSENRSSKTNNKFIINKQWSTHKQYLIKLLLYIIPKCCSYITVQYL